MGQEKHLLIVEDEALTALFLQTIIKEIGHNVIGCLSTGEDAVTFVKDQNPDMVLMDIMLAGKIDGIEAVQQIRTFTDTLVLFMTGYPEFEIHDRIKDISNIGYFMKPVNAFQMDVKIKKMLETFKDRE